MSDDTKKWVADIDAETAAEAEERLEWGERKNAIETLAELIANDGFTERTPYDARIRQLQRKRKNLESEREQINEQIEEIDGELDALRETRSSFESSEDKLKGSIESIETNLRHAGMNVYEDQPAVKDVAQKYGLSTEQVVDRVKDRNPDVPPQAFVYPMSDRFIDSWEGFNDESVATQPPEEREGLYDHET